MTTLGPTLLPGSKTTQATTVSDLGFVYWVGVNAFRVVKATSQITSPAGKVVVSAVASNTFTWAVATSTTANDPTVVGVIPNAYTATINAGDYFVVQVAGLVTAVAAAAIALNALVGCSATAGSIDDASITAGIGAIGISLNTASTAGDAVVVYLKGLI